MNGWDGMGLDGMGWDPTGISAQQVVSKEKPHV